ncbi:MAG: helix-turn-helix domain-containing protein [Bacteroidota bacterium]|nr:helix-turn-helix domain-containing protein [Bacteroidota bacterium]
MTPEILCYNITCVGFLLLAFISFFNPSGVNTTANKWFALFLFSVSSSLVNAIIYMLHAEAAYQQLIVFNELSRFAMAPALYLSVVHFTSPDNTVSKKEYLHLAPFLLFFIVISPRIFSPGVTAFNLNKLPAVANSVLSGLMFLSVKIQAVVYWLLSYQKLNKHQKNIQLINSNTTPVNLNWLKYLLYGIAAMILLWFIQLFFHVQPVMLLTSFGYLAGTFFICYFLLAQKEIYPFGGAELVDIKQVLSEGTVNAPVKKRLTDEQLDQLKIKLLQLMENERLYLDNELSLPQLAREMAVSAHDVSYLLNEGFGKNFFQFINAYRVEEARQLMLSEKHRHLNMLGIAYSAGFNSKTTFNAAFKKETGMSPSQFLQQGKNEAPASVSYR